MNVNNSFGEKENVSFKEIKSLCTIIADKIIISGRKFDTILAVSRGGLVPAGFLSHLLKIKDIRTIGVELYEWKEQKEVNFTYIPNFFLLVQKKVLIVDDVLDSGKTYSSIRKLIKKFSDHIFNFELATLYYKGNTPEPNYFGKQIDPNVWLVFPWE